MSNGHDHDKPAIYQIKVRGKLGPEWAEWFDRFSIEAQPGGETLLTGPAIDQAALFGLLLKINSLGLLLLALQRQMETESLVVKPGPLP